jgi:hypothetical protein
MDDIQIIQKNIATLAITLNTLQRVQLMTKENVKLYASPINFVLKLLDETLEYQKYLLHQRLGVI